MRLNSNYEPTKYEQTIYNKWESSNAFAPNINNSGRGTFSIVVPPPNANGNLHIGHALTNALQDIIIRYHRMKGKAVLFVPGADHAGFETQVVFERELAKKGKSRFDYSREELYDQIWKFVGLNKDNYQQQYRRLGASVDWDSFTFTLDDKITNRANITFKKMWDDGLIYRGERLINYCTFHGTAFADIEVEYKSELGKMYYIRFPLVPIEGIEDKKSYVLIATTRPETMLGDVAVAVHPEDKRFKHLVGRTIKIPLANREVPIIADAMVDKKFGTGAVKITSAHDPNDFDVAQRHNLPIVSVITEAGEIGNDAPRKYHGLTVEKARQKIIDELKEQGLLEKIEDHEHRVGHCYKCKTVIQPLIREQWFVDMQPLSKRAISILEEGKIKFYPDNKRKQLITYLQSLRDWNISRQIAWGIPIPAFQNVDDPDDWIFDTRTEKEILEIDDKTYHRDPDVFDTWFSSGQWPFATLDYPDGEKFKYFYPLDVMETGVDILAPWVSRMIMLGLYVTNDIPFKEVYLHGMVLDKHGAKMSKSKGNVVNPMDIIDQYGSDALRMGLITGQSAGNNQPFTIDKVVGARNFCNKLWNIARYIDGKKQKRKVSSPTPQTIADYWVLDILQHSSKTISRLLDKYRFSESFDCLYHTVWNEIADWYIEASKTGAGEGMLPFVLETILTLSHPFAPFVTEAIWQELGWRDELLITSAWPSIPQTNKTKSKQFEDLKKITVEIRQLIKNIGLSKPELVTDSKLILDNQELLVSLSKINAVNQGTGEGVRLVTDQAWMSVSNDKLNAYKTNLQKQITQKQNEISSLKSRLANKSYISNAPPEIVSQSKDSLESAKSELILLQSQTQQFD